MASGDVLAILWAGGGTQGSYTATTRCLVEFNLSAYSSSDSAGGSATIQTDAGGPFTIAAYPNTASRPTLAYFGKLSMSAGTAVTVSTTGNANVFATILEY